MPLFNIALVNRVVRKLEAYENALLVLDLTRDVPRARTMSATP